MALSPLSPFSPLSPLSPREVAAELLDRVLDVPGARAAPTVVAWLLAVLDADRVELYLLDRRRERLHLAAEARRDPSAGPAESHLDVRASAAGQALTTEVVLEHRVDAQLVRHIPLDAHGNTRGVLTVAGPIPADRADRADCTDGAGGTDGADREAPTVAFGATDWRRLGRTVAVLLHHASAGTDELELVSRTYDYSIAAELQWQLLPPPDVATDRFGLRALVEPAPRVTSDLFDWTLNGDRLTVALLDASGRGLAATQAGDLALAALRNARRSGLGIAEQAALADQALWDRHHGHVVVHVLLLEIDLVAPAARAVHAGSAHALRRRGREVETLDLVAHEPFGLLDRTRYEAHPVDVQPGDALLLLSDGVVTARDPAGQVYGIEGVAHRLAHTSAARELPSWLITDVRRHAGGDLDDDATALMLEWYAP